MLASISSCTAIVYNSFTKKWVLGHEPLKSITAKSSLEVIDALNQVSYEVEQKSRYAIGWVSYEAAYAFEDALQAHHTSIIPVLHFAIYATVELADRLPICKQKYTLGPWQANTSYATYKKNFDLIQEHIKAGDIYQANYTYKYTTQFQGSSLSLFNNLLQQQETPYAAYINTGDATLCSASPEIFFSLDGEKIMTKPMKGTISRGLTHRQDQIQQQQLYNSPKERAENMMIVDMIRNDLSRIAHKGSIKVPDIFTTTAYSSLWQMTSTVTATTSASLSSIFTAMFPCASITGAPKVKSMQILTQLEKIPRQIYTGAIGFYFPQRIAQFSVAIRSLIIKNNIAEYSVGSGIVDDSKAKQEYAECKLKASIIRYQNNYPAFKLVETLLWQPQRGYFLLDRHLKRLHNTAAYFNIRLRQSIAQELVAITDQFNPHKEYKVRLLVSLDGSSTKTYEVLQPLGDEFKVGLAPKAIDITDKFLYHKTTYRKQYNQMLKQSPHYNDVIFYNKIGQITETTIANIVIMVDGQYLTPKLSCGLLAGVYRAKLLQSNKIISAVISLDMLRQSEEIYLINSVRKWHKVKLSD